MTVHPWDESVQPSASTGLARALYQLGETDAPTNLPGPFIAGVSGNDNLRDALASIPFRAPTLTYTPLSVPPTGPTRRERELEKRLQKRGEQIASLTRAVSELEAQAESQDADHAAEMAGVILSLRRSEREALEMDHLYRAEARENERLRKIEQQYSAARLFFAAQGGWSEDWHPYRDMEDLPSEN